MLSFYGMTQDPIPELEYISVDPGGDVYLKWTGIAGVDGYIIFHYELQDGNYIWYGIDTIFSDNITEYTHLNAQPDSIPESYRIGELDTELEGNWSGAFGEPHATIHLEGFFDDCDSRILLEWTRYKGWGDDLLEYDVYQSLDGSPYVFLQTNAKEDTSLMIINVDANREYCFHIQGKHQGSYTSDSNRECFITTKPVEPQYINAEYASIENQVIALKFNIDPISEISHYRILKRRSGDADFDTLQVLDPYSGFEISAQDMEGDPVIQWEYVLTAYNNCGREVTRSNSAGNMVLSITHSNMINSLSWNGYQDWLGGVENYQVYRKIDNGIAELITTLNSMDTSFADDISVYSPSQLNGSFCYYIVALEGPGNPYGISGESTSNESCLTIEPTLFIPNAFIPNSEFSENRVFRPFFTFAPGEYRIVIFDRWNNKIFETENYLDGWNGRWPDGTPANVGSYVYFIRYITSEGEEVKRNGQVTLIYRQE